MKRPENQPGGVESPWETAAAATPKRRRKPDLVQEVIEATEAKLKKRRRGGCQLDKEVLAEANAQLAEELDAPAPKKKRKKPFASTKASLDYCKKQGWPAGIVERNIFFFGKRAKDGRAQTKIDLFGFVDIVSLQPGQQGVLGIQATGQSGDAAERRDKIGGIEEARVWLRAGNRIEVWHFPPRKVKRGGKRMVRPLVRFKATLTTTVGGWERMEWEEVTT